MEYEESENISTSTYNNVINQNSATNSQGTIRKYVVEKLTTNNYRMWKTRMELIMERNNLKGIVDGSNQMPEDEPEKSIWKSLDLDARMEIIMHLSDEQVDYVRDLKTAHNMWAYLKKIHQPSDGTTNFFSFRTLMNLQMNEGEYIDNFINKWQKQLDVAISAGNNIDELSKCEILMGALPQSWMTFVSIHSEDKDLTLQNVIAKLKQDELRRRRTSSQTETSHMAMAVSMKNNRGNFSKQKFQRFQNNQKYQPKNKPSGIGGFTISTITCRYCHKQGHIERDCRKKQFDIKRKGKRSYPQIHSASLQDLNINSYNEDEDNNFMQAFTCDLNERTTNQETINDNIWFFDTGATHHLTNNRNLLHNYCPLPQALDVVFGDSGRKVAIGKGVVHLILSKTKKVSIPDVYYVPGVVRNLLSVSQATRDGTTIQFNHNFAIVQHKLPNGETLRITCPKSGRLYPLQMVDNAPIEALFSSYNENTDYTLIWHHRLGHLNPKAMKTGQVHKLFEGIPTKPFSYISICEGCIYGKQCRQKFQVGKQKRTTRPLQLIHSDLCGPMQTQSINGNKYFISFIDDYTRFTILYFLKKKSGAYNAFTSYKAYVENQCQLKIAILRTDNGGEYFSNEWTKFCEENGIRHEHTVPYNPQQNGVAERKNRTLLDASRSMLQVSRLSLQFWQEAVATACYLQNRSPHKVLGLETPYSLWFKHKPHLGHLRVFGSIAYSHIPTEKRQKLDPHTRKCIFMGYGESSGMKAYKLFDPITKKFFFSRSVIFDEPSLFEKQKHDEVHNFQKNVQIHNLTSSNESQIENYGGPIARRVFKQSQISQHQNESNSVGVTHYLHNAPILSLDKDAIKEVLTPQRNSETKKVEVISTNQNNQAQSLHNESDLQNQISYRDILIKDLESLSSRHERRWSIKGRPQHPNINESQQEVVPATLPQRTSDSDLKNNQHHSLAISQHVGTRMRTEEVPAEHQQEREINNITSAAKELPQQQLEMRICSRNRETEVLQEHEKSGRNKTTVTTPLHQQHRNDSCCVVAATPTVVRQQEGRSRNPILEVGEGAQQRQSDLQELSPFIAPDSRSLVSSPACFSRSLPSVSSVTREKQNSQRSPTSSGWSHQKMKPDN